MTLGSTKAPEVKTDILVKSISVEQVKAYMLRKCTYHNNKSNLYTVVLSQRSQEMKGKLEG